MWHAHPALLPVESRANYEENWDLVDLWAVDWGPNKDAFEFHWFSSRNRKVKQIELSSPEFTLSNPGPHRVAIKAVDAFGTGVKTVVDFEIP